ncbi:HEPN domain-containing protein [bacterium]|nr:HEPN domain-containing protein [bacterium]
MVDPKIIKEWIEKAEEDFGFALVNLSDERDFYAQICFHFQQAAEKYLKAYVVAAELKFEKIHDLVRLLGICKEKDVSFDSLEEDCRFLSIFYIDTRYPVHWPANYTKEKAMEAQESAKRIRDLVKGKISI